MSQPLRGNEFHPVTAGRSAAPHRLPAGVSLLDGLRKRQGGRDYCPAGRRVTAPALASIKEKFEVAMLHRRKPTEAVNQAEGARSARVGSGQPTPAASIERRMDRSDPKHPSDGRLRRSHRTRQTLVETYLDLLRQKQKPPTAPEIARRAGCSIRSVFLHFSGLHTLSLAAADCAFGQVLAQAAVPNVDAELHTRLKAQVEARAAICERWLPLWRALLRYQSESKELAIRIKRIRAAMVARLELVYGPELSTQSEAGRTQLLVALDILTDFESWGRMREGHGLSIEAARNIWINAIGRMLPASIP
jgi:AcrR family transcriptional regulator